MIGEVCRRGAIVSLCRRTPTMLSRARFDARGPSCARAEGDARTATCERRRRRCVPRFVTAAGAFVKRDGKTVQIWAASMDWFLEEWGRDNIHLAAGPSA